MSEIAIEIINLSKSYNSTSAVKSMSFKINKGQTIGLLGPNGCGKSTTIGMLLGLVKPTTGNVLINNKNMEIDRTTLLQKMNFISPYIELPKKLTIEENLKVYGRMYGVENLDDKINQLMKMLNLIKLKKEKLVNYLLGKKIEFRLLKPLLMIRKYFY